MHLSGKGGGQRSEKKLHVYIFLALPYLKCEFLFHQSLNLICDRGFRVLAFLVFMESG